MAAECARNALLQRTMDNKENTGELFSHCNCIYQIAFPYEDYHSVQWRKFFLYLQLYFFLTQMHFAFLTCNLSLPELQHYRL